MIKTALCYSLKIWLTSVVISPIAFLLVDIATMHNQSNLEGGIGFVLLSILYGLTLSSPSWLLLWLCAYLMLRRNLSHRNIRFSLSITGTVLTLLPFLLVFGRDDVFPDSFVVVWALSYNIFIITGVWIYNIKPKPTSIFQ